MNPLSANSTNKPASEPAPLQITTSTIVSNRKTLRSIDFQIATARQKDAADKYPNNWALKSFTSVADISTQVNLLPPEQEKLFKTQLRMRRFSRPSGLRLKQQTKENQRKPRNQRNTAALSQEFQRTVRNIFEKPVNLSKHVSPEGQQSFTFTFRGKQYPVADVTTDNQFLIFSIIDSTKKYDVSVLQFELDRKTKIDTITRSLLVGAPANSIIPNINDGAVWITPSQDIGQAKKM